MLISKERDPEQKVLNNELKNLLEAAVDLPDHYCSVLVMRDVEGIDTAETSECLGISEEAVKVRLHRARALMKKQLYGAPALRGTSCSAFTKLDATGWLPASLSELELSGLPDLLQSAYRS